MIKIGFLNTGSASGLNKSSIIEDGAQG